MRALLLLLLCLVCTQHAYAQEFNAGFVEGLWYSSDKFFADQTVRIYVAIRNNTGSDLSGTVEFFDNDSRIGRKSVQALNGRIIESWTDWTPHYGEHTLSANLSRIELHTIGTSTQEVEVTASLADDVVFVDYDTDNNGVGNTEDPDDDGDGISDEQEKADGTNPLVKNIVEPELQENDTKVQEANKEHNPQTTHSGARGLEQYLAQSPAEDVLSSVTQFINTAKENLDHYREGRSSNAQTQATSTVNESGFGEIERTTASSTGFKDLSFADLFVSVYKIALAILNAVYTFVLSALSFALSYPVLMQIGLLITILFGLVKIAAKFGKRPR